MMQGVVNQIREATISLVVGNANRQNQLINAVIDTGYTGFLSLPREIIFNLNLPWTGIDRGTLGDGSEVTFEVYAATIIWDGQYQNTPMPKQFHNEGFSCFLLSEQPNLFRNFMFRQRDTKHHIQAFSGFLIRRECVFLVQGSQQVKYNSQTIG